jgi:hypothetical protein
MHAWKIVETEGLMEVWIHMSVTFRVWWKRVSCLCFPSRCDVHKLVDASVYISLTREALQIKTNVAINADFTLS